MDLTLPEGSEAPLSYHTDLTGQLAALGQSGQSRSIFISKTKSLSVS